MVVALIIFIQLQKKFQSKVVTPKVLSPTTVMCKKVHKISFLDLWQFQSQALHIISGNPPFLIPALRKIAILGLKTGL